MYMKVELAKRLPKTQSQICFMNGSVHANSCSATVLGSNGWGGVTSVYPNWQQSGRFTGRAERAQGWKLRDDRAAPRLLMRGQEVDVAEGGQVGGVDENLGDDAVVRGAHNIKDVVEIRLLRALRQHGGRQLHVVNREREVARRR